MAAMKKIFFFLLTMCLIGIACNKVKEDKEYFTLKMNETLDVPDAPLTVSFLEVSEGRCSKSTCYLCYWSIATIKLAVNNKKKTADIDLTIVGCVDESTTESMMLFVDTLEHRFQLINLSPYPDTEPIKIEDYIAKIKITKL
jgi:hypothetical protein